MSSSPVPYEADHRRIALLPYQRAEYAWVVYGQPTPAPRLTRSTIYDPALCKDNSAALKATRTPEEVRTVGITRGYYAFKAAVVAGLIDTYPDEGAFALYMQFHAHPFVWDGPQHQCSAILQYRLWMRQTSKGTCTHGDPDNIAKALIDALFVDDRHVLPQCLSLTCGAGAPRVELCLQLAPR